MIVAPELAALDCVSHGFFTRQGGVSKGIYKSLNGGLGSNDSPKSIRENRCRIAAALEVPADHLLSLYQVHSPDVITVEAPWENDADRPHADAMVTAVPGLALAISTADCGPVLFVDPKARVIGAAHSGWKGAFTGVLENTLDAMEDLGADRLDTIAVLGPTISNHAYEVGPEFLTRFLEKDPTYERFFKPSPNAGHSMFDLPAFVSTKLNLAGVGTVTDLGLCTYAEEERFYSYRRATHRGEADYGRQLSAIALRED